MTTMNMDQYDVDFIKPVQKTHMWTLWNISLYQQHNILVNKQNTGEENPIYKTL
jgi:hypothetical protein